MNYQKPQATPSRCKTGSIPYCPNPFQGRKWGRKRGKRESTKGVGEKERGMEEAGGENQSKCRYFDQHLDIYIPTTSPFADQGQT